MSAPPPPRPRLRTLAVRAYRAGLFAVIVLFIHRQHAWYLEQRRGAGKQPVLLAQVLPFFPAAASLSDWDPAHGGQNVLDAAGQRLGWVVQTAPEADEVVGFSGPTNTLLAFGPDRRIRGMVVLRSDDTPGHLREVVEHPTFLNSWNGLDAAEARVRRVVDGVSGSTLTSLAIADGIALRLGGGARTPRFPQPITVDEVAKLLPGAATLAPAPNREGLLRVLAADGALLGFAARTSPHADGQLGYQGPTDLLAVFNPDQTVRAVTLRSSFDNQPFVSYVSDDEYFLNLFKGFALSDLSRLDMVEAGIDGVTGATKTSITAAESLILAAGEWNRNRPPPAPKPWVSLSARELGSLAVVSTGLVLAFSRWKGNPRVRLTFQVVLVGYLGFTNGDLLSQALLVGWAQNGVAWAGAPALAALAAAALCAPLFTHRQVYCSHLCPFGALQDWTRKLPFQRALPAWLDRVLRWIPALLLAWVVGVAMTHRGPSLVTLEPFDAFVPRAAARASLALAALGLLAAVFINRAYCRYGCPTGALLNFLQAAAPDRLGRRDAVAAALAALAAGLMLGR